MKTVLGKLSMLSKKHPNKAIHPIATLRLIFSLYQINMETIFMFRIALVFSLLIVSGCMSMLSPETRLSSMYNVASSGLSQFDGTKYIRVTNMNCSNSIIFELYQDTVKFKQGIVLLKAGSNSITNIDGGKSLLIKIT